MVDDRRGLTDNLCSIAGYDARFPQQNQYVLSPGTPRYGLCGKGIRRLTFPPRFRTKHCWQNYVDFYKCAEAKGEEFRPCRQVFISQFHLASGLSKTGWMLLFITWSDVF